MHLGMVYVTTPPAFIRGVAPQVLDVPERPSSWTLNHTALLLFRQWITPCEGLSEDVRSSRHPLVAPSIRALRHVRDGRTDVAIGPQSPVQLDVCANGNFCVESGGRGADDAALSVAAALDVGDGDVLYGAVALDGAGDACDFGVHVWVRVRLVKGVVFSTYEGVIDVAVGCYSRGAGEGGGEVLHNGCISKVGFKAGGILVDIYYQEPVRPETADSK
jgi:hypothetical protein